MLSNRTKLFALLTVLVIASLACSTATNSGGNTTTTGDTGSSSNVLFSDDFSDTNSGWDRTTVENGTTDYSGNGTYIIEVLKDTYLLWANPYRDFGDVHVEVDATLVGGDMDNSYGIICRHLDVNNYYALVISSDGYYAIRERYQGSDLEIISGDGSSYFMDENGYIIQGYETNRIGAECVGDKLRLFVNGNLLVEVTNGDIATGDVGLIATTFSAPTTKIEFDNFVVTNP